MRRKFGQRVCAFVVAMLMLISTTSFPVYADAPTWCKVYINQISVGHTAGCTTCTLQLIFQNSGTLTSDWQLDGVQSSYSGLYAQFDKKCAGNGQIDGINNYNGANSITGDGVKWGNFVSVSKTICRSDANWVQCGSESSVGGAGTNIKSSYIVGLGNKDFRDMTLAEQVTAMKAFWAAGYWTVVGVYYEGYGHTGNGPTDNNNIYRGNHWVMLAGVDDSDVYFNDPASGKISKLSTAKGGSKSAGYIFPYHICHLLLFKNDISTPASVSGGQVQFTQSDMSNLDSMGVDSNLSSGLASGTQYVSGVPLGDAVLASCRLTEANLNDILDIVSPDNLGQTDLEMLEGWKTNIDGNKKENGFIAILRWIVSLAGILITLWAILVYLAFWFDHINSFFYVDMLHLLTFGALHICPPNEKPTFSLGKSVKDKTVSHAQILFICGAALLFGTALVSGVFYQAVSALVRLIQSFI